MVYLCHSNPIVLSTWIWTLAIPLFFSQLDANVTSLLYMLEWPAWLALSQHSPRKTVVKIPNSSVNSAQTFRSPQVWQVKCAREQGKHFGWIFLVLYAMFVKLFTIQLNKLVSKRLLFYLFILFYLPHNNYKKYRKRRKKEVARRPNRNYRSLWEVRPLRTMS